MKFSLDTLTTAVCSNVNFRPELHGDQKVNAVDIDVNFDLPNSVLDSFHPELKAALYYSKAQRDGQGEIVPEAVPPNYRFGAGLGLPLKWDEELTGVFLTIDYGLGPEAGSNIELDGCKVKKWRLTPKEGGTVNVACQIQNGTEALDDIDLCGIIIALPLKPTIQIMLEGPVLDEVKTIPPTDPFTGGGDDRPDLLTPEKALARELQRAEGGKDGQDDDSAGA